MQQVKLEKYIQELLQQHDCVVVPHFGGFIGNYIGANLHSHNSTIHPPSKGILFNRHLQTNDGVLVSAISSDLSIPLSEALDLLVSSVEEWKEVLNKGENVKLSTFGTLYKNVEGIVLFNFNNDENLLISSFGLKPIPAVPATVTSISNETKEISIQVASPSSTKKWKYIAAAVLLPIGVIAASLLFQNNSTSTSINSSSFFGWSAPNKGVYKKRVASKDSQLELEETKKVSSEKKLTVGIDKREELIFKEIIPLKDIVENPEEIDFDAVAPIPLKYFVIGGCFSNKNNADQLVEELKKEGYASSILDQKGSLYRVSIQGYPTRKGAVQTVRDFRNNKEISAWLLKK